MDSEALYWMQQNPISTLFLVLFIIALLLCVCAVVLALFVKADDEACMPEKHCGNCKHKVGSFYDNRCAECQKSDPYPPHWEKKEGVGYRS